MSTNRKAPDKVRIALVSMKSMFIDPGAPKHEGIGDVEANLARHRYWLDKALAREARFVGFPEFALNGWSRRPESALSLSSAPIRELERWAREEGIYLATGFVEKRAGKLYNSCLLTGPKGRIGVMRKVVLMADYFTPGTTYPVFDVAGFRMGVSICADGTYMETFRLLSFRGAEVIFAPHANTLGKYGGHADGWTEWRKERWPLFTSDTCVIAAGINNAGQFAGRKRGPVSTYCGGGMVMDWTGRICKRVSGKGRTERLLMVDLDLAGLRAARADHASFRQFRPGIVYNRKSGFVHGKGHT